MISARNLVISFLGAALLMPCIIAQDLSRYRQFQLGMDLSSAAEKADMGPSLARLIHQRPALIQELEWRSQNSLNSPLQTDSVNKILFGFYSGRLYRIVVSYDRDKTEGLTEEDLIESISAQYGASYAPAAKIISSSSSQAYGDSEKVLARWEDAQYSVNLFRFSYQSAFGLLVFSKRLDALAQAAILEAIRLNEQEAPQREIERQNKLEEEKRAAGQKARPANKAGFRP
ncbi:MAG: hypothetical protein JXA73_12595 [Acidobacteria bacterium]|nr:hypothetical protein [Acidobacteriota bacterium]